MYELPDSLEVNGVIHPIRTDFRDIMRIMYAMNDPNLEDSEKAYICLYIVYEDFDEIYKKDYEEAFKAASRFIDCDNEQKKKAIHGRTVDFEQDERLIIPAVNRVAGTEIRSMDYLHWWTFMSYFMEIGECTYSTVLSLRSKKSKGKRLEKWEEEFWNDNKDICVIHEKYSDEEIAEQELILSLIDPKGGRHGRDNT